MTAFEFMVNAFFMLAGIVCVALAAVVIYAVSIGIYRGIKKGARNDGRK